MPYFIKNKRHTCSVQVSSNNLGYNILFFLLYSILFRCVEMGIRLYVRS